MTVFMRVLKSLNWQLDWTYAWSLNKDLGLILLWWKQFWKQYKVEIELYFNLTLTNNYFTNLDYWGHIIQ